jgi:hypothetical protein
MSRAMKGIIFGSCVLMGMVAFFAITDSGSAAELPQVIRISCAYNSATYGAGVVDCQPGFSKGNVTKDTVRFTIGGTCQLATPHCINKYRIQTKMPPEVPLTFDCPPPGVSYTFWGGSSNPQNSAGYIYANGYANSDMSAVQGSSSVSCVAGPPVVLGPKTWPGLCI